MSNYDIDYTYPADTRYAQMCAEEETLGQINFEMLSDDLQAQVLQEALEEATIEDHIIGLEDAGMPEYVSKLIRASIARVNQ